MAHGPCRLASSNTRFTNHDHSEVRSLPSPRKPKPIQKPRKSIIAIQFPKSKKFAALSQRKHARGKQNGTHFLFLFLFQFQTENGKRQRGRKKKLTEAEQPDEEEEERRRALAVPVPRTATQPAQLRRGRNRRRRPWPRLAI